MPRWTVKVVVSVLTIAASWGGWQLLPASSPPSIAPNVMALQPAPVPRLASVAVIASPAKHSIQRAQIVPAIATDTRTLEATKPAPSAAAPGTVKAPAPKAAGESRPIRTDRSTELVSARATTWVNVRTEANASSAIVGIVQPDSIVELGESRRGWRRVSTRWFSGWASARLFIVDSLP